MERYVVIVKQLVRYELAGFRGANNWNFKSAKHKQAILLEKILVSPT